MKYKIIAITIKNLLILSYIIISLGIVGQMEYNLKKVKEVSNENVIIQKTKK